MAQKITKANPSEFELSVAQELLNLEASAAELKSDLSDLKISGAKEIELDGGRRAIVVSVPFPQLKYFHKIQPRLIRELEKKFRYFFSLLPFLVYT
jgi:small subunit ribosomal protein S7e